MSNNPPMPAPPDLPANPSASISTLWAYMRPALDHIVRSSTNETSKAPSIDSAYYGLIYSHIFKYVTSSRKENHKLPGLNVSEHMDQYYAEVAHELLLDAPRDSSALIPYVIACFNRYSAGAKYVSRLLSYPGRHYVALAIDEGDGWFRDSDHPSIMRIPKSMRKSRSLKHEELKRLELMRWGYVDGSKKSMEQAEACAEAASPVGRTVPFLSVAYRRFRTEVIEPLLTDHDTHDTDGKRGQDPRPSLNPESRGQLSRAVNELLKTSGEEKEGNRKLVTELATILKSVGVQPDHTLRETLDRFIALQEKPVSSPE